jgi:biotin carboxylase
MQNTVLILGGSEEFLRLVRLARERGIKTIVCDGRDNSPAKAEADLSYDIPVTSIDEIAKVCRRHQVDGILTGFSDLLLECMVKICAAAELPCYLTPDQLPFYRNKDVMKQTLDELGVGASRARLPGGGKAGQPLRVTRAARPPLAGRAEAASRHSRA